MVDKELAPDFCRDAGRAIGLSYLKDQESALPPMPQLSRDLVKDAVAPSGA